MFLLSRSTPLRPKGTTLVDVRGGYTKSITIHVDGGAELFEFTGLLFQKHLPTNANKKSRQALDLTTLVPNQQEYHPRVGGKVVPQVGHELLEETLTPYKDTQLH